MGNDDNDNEIMMMMIVTKRGFGLCSSVVERKPFKLAVKSSNLFGGKKLVKKDVETFMLLWKNIMNIVSSWGITGYFLQIIKLLRFLINIFFGFIFMCSLYKIFPIEILILGIFLLLVLCNFLVLYKHNLINFSNKILIKIFNINYLNIIQRIIIIKVILLAGYSLNISLCDSTFNSVSHNMYLNATTSFGFSSPSSNTLLQVVGIAAIIGGVSYVAYNYYNSSIPIPKYETITLAEKKALFKSNILVKECLDKKDSLGRPLNYVVNYKYYGSNLYQNELMKQNYLRGFKRSYSDSLLPALAVKKDSCSVKLGEHNVINIYNITSDHVCRETFHGHTTEVVLKIVYIGIRNLLDNTISGMALCQILETFGIKSDKPTPDKVGQILVKNIRNFLDEITNDFEKK